MNPGTHDWKPATRQPLHVIRTSTHVDDPQQIIPQQLTQLDRRKND